MKQNKYKKKTKEKAQKYIKTLRQTYRKPIRTKLEAIMYEQKICEGFSRFSVPAHKTTPLVQTWPQAPPARR